MPESPQAYLTLKAWCALAGSPSTAGSRPGGKGRRDLDADLAQVCMEGERRPTRRAATPDRGSASQRRQLQSPQVARPKATLEREVKLGAERGFSLRALEGQPLEPRVFTSTYFDTEGFRLANAGITLRRRVERAHGVWQLKLPGGDGRLELELPGGPEAPPPELLELLTASARGAVLRPVAKLRTQRTGVRVTDGGGAVADVTLDLVAVLDGRRITSSFREIEAEPLDGGEPSLRWLEKTLREAGARDGDGRPKVFRALGIEPRSPPRSPEPSAPAGEHLRVMLERQYRAILAHDPGTRLGADPEDLHQLRVATRRSRAFLRAARPLLEREWSEPLRAELQWLGAALGPVRDLDVLLAHLRESAVTLEAPEQHALRRLLELLEAERERARASMLEALRSERYVGLLDRLESAARQPRLVSSALSVADIAAAEFRRLRRAVKRLPPEPSDEELHELRIRGKRARYAAELAAAAVGKPALRFVAEAKAFQDVLGEHQDAVVAEDRLRAALERVSGRALAFAVGRLVERERRRRALARAAFPRAWSRLERRGKEAWR
jgi:CHAD domain-containing protein